MLLWFFLIGVDCFGLKKLFEDCAHIKHHKIEHCMSVFLEPEYGDSHHIGYFTVYNCAVGRNLCN